ncbi:MAG: DAK2 domain-containing protein [Clostridiales bacterium]|nr:DAK2 domain-containing protein [Clostridiales bacterium]
MTHQINGALFKAMIINGAAAIDNHKGEINELNVFPVPDGDTGTNMSLTMGAGAAALADSSPGTVGRAAEITAGALLRGARGNSGVILSLFFRGIARHLKDMDTADALDFSHAITSGVEAAYKAVMKPTEGTILTVSRLAAEAAVTASESESDIEAVMENSISVGYEALDNTINQNPVLKKAGVVDAGGKGYLYILEGMLKSLRGEIISRSADFGADAAPSPEGGERADFSSFDTQDIKFAYCTEFIVGRKNQKDVNYLRDFLDIRGDSIVVVDDDELIKGHVHSNEPGVIITEALTYGPLIATKIENMREQHSGKLVESQAEMRRSEENTETDSVPQPQNDAPDAESAAGLSGSDAVSEPPKKLGVVAVCAGDGMCNVFRDLGVDQVIVGGQTMNPSTEDILTKIEAINAEAVFVLPNNKNIIMAAQQCARLTEKKVIVIPSKSMPQGISAMIALDAAATIEENMELMCEAISRVHTAQITFAARDSEFDGHSIKSGDYIALLEDSLVATGSETIALVDAVALSLAKYNPEFITVFSGADVDENTTSEVLKRLSSAIPDAETSVVYGGQPVYYFLISAE